MDQKKEILVKDPDQLEKKIMDLESNTSYLIYIYGTTKAGAGEEQSIDEKTREAARGWSLIIINEGTPFIKRSGVVINYPLLAGFS